MPACSRSSDTSPAEWRERQNQRRRGEDRSGDCVGLSEAEPVGRQASDRRTITRTARFSDSSSVGPRLQRSLVSRTVSMTTLVSGRCHDRAQCHPLGQSWVHSGEFRRLRAPGTGSRRWASAPQASGSVARQSLDQHRSAGGMLQISMRLSLVLRAAITAYSRSAVAVLSAWVTGPKPSEVSWHRRAFICKSSRE